MLHLLLMIFMVLKPGGGIMSVGGSVVQTSKIFYTYTSNYQTTFTTNVRRGFQVIL